MRSLPRCTEMFKFGCEFSQRSRRQTKPLTFRCLFNRFRGRLQPTFLLSRCDCARNNVSSSSWLHHCRQESGDGDGRDSISANDAVGWLDGQFN